MRRLHGGDLGPARAAFGEPEGGWIDLSTGVNPWPWPWPWPAPPLPPEALTRLPSAEGLADLSAAAARAFGAPRALPAPGAQAAILQLPFCAPPGDVAVVSPTYGEHAPAWEAAGRRVRLVAEPEPAGVLVVANPNNPDGRCWRPEELLGVDCGLLVVDESFVDPTPALSLAGRERAVLLRSFGKFYGLPGLRLGFVLGPGGLLDRLAARFGPWPVSGAGARDRAARLPGRGLGGGDAPSPRAGGGPARRGAGRARLRVDGRHAALPLRRRRGRPGALRPAGPLGPQLPGHAGPLPHRPAAGRGRLGPAGAPMSRPSNDQGEKDTVSGISVISLYFSIASFMRRSLWPRRLFHSAHQFRNFLKVGSISLRMPK